jgi:Co/Zn/Cd efflux system component
MYEPRTHRPLPTHHFVWRVVNHVVTAVGLVVGSLSLGMAGYVYFEKLSLLDAFLNAAMLLGGMGPVNLPATEGGKLFAGVYALYAGLVFLAVAGLLLAPFVHRLLHKFHWDTDAN